MNCMAALYHAREYLGVKELAVAFRSFVRPVCEYSGVAFMGASATHLSKFDKVQKLAEKMSGGLFPALQSCHAASTFGLHWIFIDVAESNFVHADFVDPTIYPFI